MLYGQLSWIRGEKFLPCFQTGRENSGVSGYPMAGSEGHASLSLQHCVCSAEEGALWSGGVACIYC